jgi:hypothetical protein
MSETHEIKSKFGNLEVVLTEANHAFVSTPRSEGITVNTVTYYVNCHLYRWSTGEWRIGQEGKSEYEQRQSLHLTRKSWTTYRESLPSRAAYNKAAVEIRQAFVDFIHANPQVAEDAEREHLRETLEKFEHEYAEAVQKADEARKARDLAQDAYMYVLRNGRA